MVGEALLVILAQVGLDDLGVALNLARAALRDFHAVVEDGDALAAAHHDLHRMLDEEAG